MEKVLHIIAMGDPDWDNKESLVPEEEKDNAGFWYFHGKLEEMFHYDKGLITNCKTLGISKPYKEINGTTFPQMYLNDIVRCEIDGVEDKCTGFFWVIDRDNGNWIQRGLVVLDNDKEAYNDAMTKYNEKRFIL